MDTFKLKEHIGGLVMKFQGDDLMASIIISHYYLGVMKKNFHDDVLSKLNFNSKIKIVNKIAKEKGVHFSSKVAERIGTIRNTIVHTDGIDSDSERILKSGSDWEIEVLIDEFYDKEKIYFKQTLEIMESLGVKMEKEEDVDKFKNSFSLPIWNKNTDK